MTVPALLHLRRAFQIVLLITAALIVVHGLFGPQIAPRNLATVLTWVHYRGLLMVALLAIGNVFCMGCPMVLARDAARRVAHFGYRWPRYLRTKWIAATLLVAVLFAYELFDLWDLPRGTAYLVLAYFAAAIVIDVLFAGASFCKYVCPIGQFNFVASTMSPTELRVEDVSICRSCATVDCIKGTRSTVVPQPTVIIRRGCELSLFQPAKVGNLDCTLCLDCVRACPHDNVTLAWRVPGQELVDDERRSGIGRLTRRPDLAALTIVFTFGALLNAFAMTRPVYAVERWIAGLLGVTREWPVMLTLFALGLVVVPGLLLGAAAALSRQHGDPTTLAGRLVRYSYGLIPVGTAMWAAHYGFHLMTGAFSIVPVAQSAAGDLAGADILGAPLWHWAGMQPGAVFPLQLGVLLLGTIGSLALMRRIGSRGSDRSIGAYLPWATAVIVIAAAAVWVLAQPMEMRGLGFFG